MREIKFRVWDKKNKKMYYGYKPDRPNMIDFDGNLCITGTGNIDEYGSPTDYIIGCKQQNYILMQYIGLKDKTGKEIYEGDIVRQRRFLGWDKQNGERYKDIYGVVRFENGMFTCGIVDNTIIDWNKCEVIGNKWENPELLEEEK